MRNKNSLDLGGNGGDTEKGPHFRDILKAKEFAKTC
jgi:hypothetical protein